MRKSTRFSRKSKKIDWVPAPDIKRRIGILTSSLELDWLKPSRLFCFRSSNAKTRAYARIWGFSKIWQKALKEKPAYILEVISEKYDPLPEIEKDKVLLHEITHIPQNFSGSLLPHIRRGKRSFNDRVRILIAQYFKNLKQ